MENALSWVQKRGQGKKDSLYEASESKKLAKRGISRPAMLANTIQSQNINVFPKHLFFLLVHGHYKIPKLLASADEMYLRRCLESVHNSALKASQHNKPVSLETKNLWTSAEKLNTVKFIGGTECGGSDQLVLAHSVAESVVDSTIAAENWNLGTVMGTKSMINILNSPLLQQFGASERNENLNNMNFSDAKNTMCYDFVDSPSGFSISSHRLVMETPVEQSHMYGSISVHKRTTTKTNSACFDWMSSAVSKLSQGMLQCTWKQGVPHFVFSVDDQKEVYVAKLSKTDTIHDEDLDYVYLFHLNKGSQKGHEISDCDLQLVGKMNVSTCLTLCPDNLNLMETKFILFSNCKIYDKEMFTPSHFHTKNKAMAKKASQVLRTSPSPIHRTLSRFSRSKTVRERCALDQQSCVLERTNLLESNVPPNFELAAIVVKDHRPSHSLDKVGGWGLKFLDKPGVNPTTLPSESCNRNSGASSSSTSIIIPAGFHGGPRTRHNGPSSLIDRWKSGGRCDCGGWDEGCPLTVLQRRSSNEELLSHVDMQGECKSIELVTQVC
ncbi:unnamed protein product [Sphenostylis stenocarpa]|uniref:Uncharacterized protein n=1 Tax=Sphenostylis stenocarpa TaxID=92480 RepID=A0AA86SMW3_9FABA|nr:unnamed protein product [Sphenostylis stenocarpa]